VLQRQFKESYFDDIRLPEQEKFEPPQIDLSIDDHGRENLSIDELKDLVYDALVDITSDTFDF